MDLVSKEFAEKVKSARELMNMSQSELARQTGLTGQFISKLESGETRISLHHALSIAVALSMGAKDLVGLLNTARQTDLFSKRKLAQV